MFHFSYYFFVSTVLSTSKISSIDGTHSPTSKSWLKCLKSLIKTFFRRNKKTKEYKSIKCFLHYLHQKKFVVQRNHTYAISFERSKERNPGKSVR